MADKKTTAADILKLIKDKEVKYVDIRFTDPRGKWQHVTFDLMMVDDDFLNEGTMFDGSSIAGWKAINESDMLLKPDLDTAVIDPFFAQTTLILICDVLEPTTGQHYARCPRSIAKAAEAFVNSSGVGDTTYFGPEAEFFIFDDVRFDVGMNKGFYYLELQGRRLQHRHRISGRQSGPSSQGEGRLFPRAAGGQRAGHARRDAGGHARHGHPAGKAPPRSRHRPARTWLQVQHADQVRRLHADLQVCDPPGRPGLWQDGDLHAQAGLWRQRLGHACAPVDLEGRQAAVRRFGLCRPVGHLPLLHRRHHQACQGAQRLHQPADQQLQAPDPGLRGAGAAGLFVAQPLGLVPHSLLALAQGQARRGPLPRSGREPLSRLCRDADGGPGRHREQDPSGRPDGQGPLCPAAGRAGEGAAGLRLACAKRWTASKADHAFLKKGGVFSEDFIESYIELKMEEVYAFEHTPHPIEFKMYYSV